MKLLGLLLAVLVALGAAVLYQRTRHAQTQQQMAVATAKAEAEHVAAQAREIEEAKARAEADREKLLKLTREMGSELDRRNLELTNRLKAAAAAGASDQSGSNSPAAGFGAAIANMMKDPETKKFIRDQQRMMMDTMYAPLIRQMGLSREEGEQFKDFLADQAMKATDRASALMGGGANANRTEQLKELAESQKAMEAETKEFLGEERFAQYKDYQVTMQERVQLNMFRQQSGDNAISDAQAEQLLAVMKQEKTALAADSSLIVPGAQDANNMDAMLSEDGAEKILRAQETLNERVYQKATDLLQPEQLASFGRFQTNQLQTMRMGISMARKMFAPQK